MSRQQDQRLVEAYERIAEAERYKVGDKFLYIGDNKKLKGKKGTVQSVGVRQIKFSFDDTPNKVKTIETPLPGGFWKKINEDERLDEFGMVIGTPLSRRKEPELVAQEGRMKELGMDLFDVIGGLEDKVFGLVKKHKSVLPKQCYKHLIDGMYSLGKAKNTLPMGEAVSEGFVNNVGRGKVPIGHWSFEYIPEKGKKDIQFLINSMKHRDPEAIIKLKNSVVMTGFAGSHQSLITSLQKLNFNGEVVDWNRKERGVVVYQKEGK